MKRGRIIIFLIFALILIRILIVLISEVPFVIALASKKVSLTDATVLGRDDESLIVSYSTEQGSFCGKHKLLFSWTSRYKKGDSIQIYYNTEDNSVLYGNTSILQMYVCLFLFIYVVVFESPSFKNLMDEFNSRKWESAELELVDMTAIEHGYILKMAREENDKKIIVSVFVDSNYIKIFKDTGIIDKVPVKIYPKDKRKIVIDENALKEKSKINICVV